ncbi:PA14 domain-containing protein [Streptomyces bullii]|uniref:PA14 domain-containing protein n=1 Tax=Streptomyces bullii TaxID=349910 RepID=A0ABW0UMI7_9ACTN
MNPARRTTAAFTTGVVLATAGGLVAAATPASAATSCTSPVFKRQFYANTTLSGAPKKVDCDSRIDQDWGTGAPATGLPKDNFGVRWTVTRDFGSGGPFSFAVASRDGIRVYLDGVREVDLWKNVATTQKKTVDVTVPPGRHTLRVDYVNWTGAANVAFDYYPRNGSSIDKVKPLAPAGVSVTYDKVTGEATVKWAKNKEMDLLGYRVYKRLPWQEFPRDSRTRTTATTYTEQLEKAGNTYLYEVRAIDKSGNESTGSADVAVTTADELPPERPNIAWTEPSNKAVKVRWTASHGADGYEVYRAPSQDGPYTLLAKPATPAFDDVSADPDVTYWYRVRATDKAGNVSAYSYTRGEWDTLAPLAPQNLTVTEEDAEGITLTWNSVGAPEYRVYRSTSPASYGDLIATTPTVTTAYRDTTGEPGQPYYYRVTSADPAGNESAADVVTATRRPASAE